MSSLPHATPTLEDVWNTLREAGFPGEIPGQVGVAQQSGDAGAESACHFALKKGHAHLVPVLLAHHVPVETDPLQAVPLLRDAIRAHVDFETLRALFERTGLTRLPRDFLGQALFRDIRDARILGWAMGHGASLDWGRNRSEGTLLHQFLGSGMIAPFSMVEPLLELGADPNACNRDGETPLMEPFCQPNLEKIRLFVRFGADLSKTDEDGKNLLMRSWQSLVNPDQTEAFHALIDLLVSAGVDLNQQDRRGRTVLADIIIEGWENTYHRDKTLARFALFLEYPQVRVNLADSEGLTLADHVAARIKKDMANGMTGTLNDSRTLLALLEERQLKDALEESVPGATGDFTRKVRL
jgi:hypothetical protein